MTGSPREDKSPRAGWPRDAVLAWPYGLRGVAGRRRTPEFRGAHACARLTPMSQANPIRLFVTHVWEDNDDYLRVFEYLESAKNFFYKNYSTPDRPPAGDKEAQREDLRRQIAPVEAVIAIPSLLLTHRDMFTFELLFAQASQKPVILMKPFGSQCDPSQGDHRSRGRNRRLGRAGAGGCDPAPGAARRHHALGHDRVQARLGARQGPRLTRPYRPPSRLRPGRAR